MTPVPDEPVQSGAVPAGGDAAAAQSPPSDAQQLPPVQLPHTPPPRAAAPTSRDPGNIDTTRSMLADIRQRLSAIAVRELAVQRREAELEQQYRLIDKHAREQAQQDLDQARRRLEARSAELNAQALELSTRRTRMDRHEAQLAARDARLEQAQKDLEQSAERQREREEAHRLQRGGDRKVLTDRIALIREREKELERRIQLARDDIVRQRQSLDEQLAQLEARAVALEERSSEIDAQDAGLAGRISELNAQDAELARQRQELEGERSELRGHLDALQRESEELEQQRRGLADRQRELDQHWKTTREQRGKLIKQIEDFSAQQRAAKDAQHALDEQQQRLDARERELLGQATRLETEARRFEEMEEDLRQRRAEADHILEQAAAAEREAQHVREEALLLREQVEARDADTRQEALAVELERQQLVHDRALVERGHLELVGLRDAREQEFQQLRLSLDEQAERLRRSQQTLFAAPQRWWLRAGALAAALALGIGYGWLRWEAPVFRGVGALQIASQGASPQRVAAEHAAALLNPRVFDGKAADETLPQTWSTAIRGGRVTVVPNADSGALEIRVVDADAARAENLARKAADAYAKVVNDAPAAAQAPLIYADLQARREAVEQEWKQAVAQRSEAQSLLATAPAVADREALLVEVQRLRREHTDVASRLSRARETLNTLLAGGVPQITLEGEAVEEALASDEVYQEDLKEFRSEARQYQAELAVAMVLLVDPIKSLRGSLRKFADTLVEQRQLQPPEAVAAVVEAISARQERFEQRIAEFASGWEESRQAVERYRFDDDVVALVKLQSTATEQASKLVEDSQAFFNEVRAEADKLGNATPAGTREVVVSATLRSELSRLGVDIAALTPTAGATDATTNFQLDSRDRQLRGLRTRLQQRKEAAREQLQAAADRLARENHDEQAEQARQIVLMLEQRRDDLVAGLAERLDAVRQADEAAAKRRTIDLQIASADREIGRLEAQRGRLDDALAEALRSGPKPDRVETVTVKFEQIAGTQRWRHALAAGLGAAATVFGLCVLMILRSPLVWLSHRITSPAAVTAAMPTKSAAK